MLIDFLRLSRLAAKICFPKLAPAQQFSQSWTRPPERPRNGHVAPKVSLRSLGNVWESPRTYLNCLDFHWFSLIVIDVHRFPMILNVLGFASHDLHWFSYISIEFLRFSILSLVCLDFHRFSFTFFDVHQFYWFPCGLLQVSSVSIFFLRFS